MPGRKYDIEGCLALYFSVKSRDPPRSEMLGRSAWEHTSSQTTQDSTRNEHAHTHRK